MQEQHNEENHVEYSHFDKLYAEADTLDVHIPTYVKPGFERLFKFAYLQVKKDPGCQGMSSANRKRLIIGLMNMYYKKIVENTFETEAVQTGLAVESVSDKKVEGTEDGKSEPVL